MFVYASTGWVPAGSSVNGTSRRFRYIATAGQTTFTGSDSNGNTMAYDAGFVDVYLNGVRLDQTDYTATSGTSIVLASAAALNDELNIVAFGTFSVASINGVDIINGTVSANKLASDAPAGVSDKTNTSTGYMMMPVGTTAQRPGTPNSGMYRMNATTGEPEWYDSISSEWKTFGQSEGYAIDYLVVAGGGSGAEGGGGAGGFLAKSDYMRPSVAYAVTVGAGGAGSTWSSGFGASGNNSSLVTASGTQTAFGGGKGGNVNGDDNKGGSGGGGRRDGNTFGGAGYFGQGNGGGTSPMSTTGYAGGGGGGGGGGCGQSGGNWNYPTAGATSEFGGAGGPGIYWHNNTAYCGGGGGGVENGSTSQVAPGGIGGGGHGNKGSSIAPTSATANTGGGGGGLGSNTAFSSGSGGSGVVIIRYPGAQRGTGGTVTSAGGYTYHTFTSSGTFTA